MESGFNSPVPLDDAPDEDDEDDYDDQGGGNRLLGFMFGNVDCSGDLDADYLDEDAKEHLAALADKLGPSLAGIDITKSPSSATDASEQDYDEKAENAIDYEDIEEQYEGPEVQSVTEQDSLLREKEYYTGDISVASMTHKVSLFDDENYDEDDDVEKENEAADASSASPVFSSGEKKLEVLSNVEEPPFDNFSITGSSDNEQTVFNSEDFQEDPAALQGSNNPRSGISLPILCVEDGMVILRFSEIFGIHAPLKKVEKRGHHRYCKIKENVETMDVADSIEEDEEIFLRSTCHDHVVARHPSLMQEDYVQFKEVDGAMMIDHDKDSCLFSQPMKETVNTSAGWMSPVCPEFYPLDQQDWENEILWGNSPPNLLNHRTSGSCVISEHDSDSYTNVENEEEVSMPNLMPGFQIEPHKYQYLASYAALTDPFSSRKLPEQADSQSLQRNYHPQILRLQYSLENDEPTDANTPKGLDEICRHDAVKRFRKLSLQNREFFEGSWLDQIIWDPNEYIPKPKLIFDLQDDQMLFEILEQKDIGHLRSHASAMILNHLSKSSAGYSLDLSSQSGASVGRFNISNDKYYSNRKTGQQSKSHTKKRGIHGLKVMHSVPALKLQTMKPKLSNKEIANFHRPRAPWYPHDNEFITKAEGMPCNQGPIKIILKSLGGKGTKFHVAAEETLLAVKFKFAKKLDFKPSEKVKVFYYGKELEDDKPLAAQNVRPNSLLQIVRTKINLWPRAQKLPGENKPLRPPGAFKKKSDLSVKDGHVFLMEYCEERPLLLGNVGMGARLCTYYQKSAPGDQSALSLRNGNSGLGNVLTLDPADRAPFLGDITPGCSQSSIETNMYRAPLFPHMLSSTDYLLVRSAKGMLSLRRIDKLYVVGQQEPHMEVMSPGTKNVQTYVWNRLLVYVYREFRAKEKPGFRPYVRADEISALFPSLTEALVRKRLKHCADLKKGRNGILLWEMRPDFRIPSEEELRRMVSPENVCSYESMQAGLYRLKHLGIGRLTHPIGLSSAMNQLPDEAIALAAASHIERELLITSWNLSSNFVACTNQDRENIERLEITGVGDPSGRGLGFSYVRVTPKAPFTSAVVKKKASAVTAGRGSSTVTGTDADLRRLSMDAAREVLLKFNVPDEQIGRLTRWHRIAMVRRLSSEQAASGVTVDATTLSKFARGQRMSFLQLQQQTREKCQEIWDRQIQSLSAADGEENESDSEANSDLDSFAGDLENLLDAEECEEGEEGNIECKNDKADVVKGLKMRRCPSQAQAKEEVEDNEAEAAAIRRLLEDDETELKKEKKIKPSVMGPSTQLPSQSADVPKKASTIIKRIVTTLPQPTASFTSKEISVREPKEVVKEKKPTDKPVRESFVCGACGQMGHMRTNKNCPRYGEESETTELETASLKSHPSEVMHHLLPKTPNKRLMKVEASESAEKSGVKAPAKIPSLKFKYGPADTHYEKSLPGSKSSEKQTNMNVGMETKPTKKINKIIISNKLKHRDVQQEVQRPSVVIRMQAELESDQPRKKIIFKQSKGVANLDNVGQAPDIGVDDGFRKTKKITELASLETPRKQQIRLPADEIKKGKATDGKRFWKGEGKKDREHVTEERTRRMLQGERRIHERQRLLEIREYEEAKEWEEQQKAKKNKNKNKNKKPNFRDEYLEENRTIQSDRKIPERDRAAKRRPIADLVQHAAEYTLPTKRRRRGEVSLSNILENIVDTLRNNTGVSYLFLKPVSKKEAPDYLDVIKNPMDLGTIKEKARKMEYKNRDEFRHDVWQITYNAHKYNDKRNPGIPPLADQLLELCDYCLEQERQRLTEAESGIE
uniref:Transcription initiation factor TFIID subunit 1 n=1 Tax=Anthurium amnicola TaxID=1678845 RepID=A0A1D1Y4I7_9ARAE